MEQLAIMKKVEFGKQEHIKGLVLHFEVQLLNGGASLMVDYETLKNFMEEEYIENISWFEGKPCVVSVSEDRTVKFISFR